MNSDIERQLQARYPALYSHLAPRWEGAPLFECEDGWRAIVEALSLRLMPYADLGLSVTTVKQKLGALRIGIELVPGDRRIVDWTRVDRWIHEATEQSRVTCERCGDVGCMRTEQGRRHPQVLCTQCAKARGYAAP